MSDNQINDSLQVNSGRREDWRQNTWTSVDGANTAITGSQRITGLLIPVEMPNGLVIQHHFVGNELVPYDGRINQPDGLIYSGFSFNADKTIATIIGSQWRVSDRVFTLPNQIDYPKPPADAGLFRMDYIIGRPDGSTYYREGEAGATAVPPELPYKHVLIQEIVVTDPDTVATEPPIPVSDGETVYRLPTPTLADGKVGDVWIIKQTGPDYGKAYKKYAAGWVLEYTPAAGGGSSAFADLTDAPRDNTLLAAELDALNDDIITAQAAADVAQDDVDYIETILLPLKENKIEKDASGGYAGLTLFKINFRNALNTFTSFLTNANTAIRTYTFPDKDGTVAMLDDVGTDLGWYNVKDYGATGDGTTDDTAAFQATYTAMSSTGGVFYIPFGNYKITSGLTFTKNVRIMGDGMDGGYVSENRMSRISYTHATTACFTINSPISVVDSLGMIYTGSTPSAGNTAIKYTNGHSMKLERCTFSDFYDNVRVETGCPEYVIDRCNFFSPFRYALYLDNVANMDYGDQGVSNCVFRAHKRNATAGVFFNGGGGLRFVNNKINASTPDAGVTIYGFNYGMDFPNNTGVTGVLIITGNSIENCKINCIRMNPVNSFSNFVITGNELAFYFPPVAGDLIYITGSIQKGLIAANVFESSGVGVYYAINLNSKTGIQVYGNSFSPTIATDRYLYQPNNNGGYFDFNAPLRHKQQASLLTTPVSGVMEYDGTHLYISIGTTRYQLDQQSTGGSGGAPTRIFNVTIAASGWTLVSGFYEYTYSNALLTVKSIVDVVPQNAYIAIVRSASILPLTTSAVGTCKFYANNLPSGDITVNIIITESA